MMEFAASEGAQLKKRHPLAKVRIYFVQREGDVLHECDLLSFFV